MTQPLEPGRANWTTRVRTVTEEQWREFLAWAGKRLSVCLNTMSTIPFFQVWTKGNEGKDLVGSAYVVDKGGRCIPARRLVRAVAGAPEQPVIFGTINTTLSNHGQWLKSCSHIPREDRADTRLRATARQREIERRRDEGDWPVSEQEKRDWFWLFTRAFDEGGDDVHNEADESWGPWDLDWTVSDTTASPPRWRRARCCLSTLPMKGGGVVLPVQRDVLEVARP